MLLINIYGSCQMIDKSNCFQLAVIIIIFGLFQGLILKLNIISINERLVKIAVK